MESLSPSAYLRDMTLTLHQKLHKDTQSSLLPLPIVTQLNATCSSLPLSAPLFAPKPALINIQNFEAFQTYNIELQFQNLDSVPRSLKLEQIDHPCLVLKTINSNSLAAKSIAPGISVTYIIQFTPEDDNLDYSYKIVVNTEREQFLVPLLAIGNRAILDFPDEIVFKDVPVRFSTTRTILVRNIGARAAKFALNALPPFYPSPPMNFLEAGEMMQIDSTGNFATEMELLYDTGERNCILLIGNAEDADIRLEFHTLDLPDTSITLTSSKTIKIHNRSDLMAAFHWKLFSNDSEENVYRRAKLLEQATENQDEDAAYKMDHWNDKDSTLYDLSVLHQKHKNTAREIQSEKFLFEDSAFEITPIQGTIWPNSYVEIAIHFKPEYATHYSRSVFCEVSGRETRLPLTILGSGIGPKARFSVDEIDVENVFINTMHRYQITLENLGDIDIHYKIEPNVHSQFRSKFKFSSDEGVIGVKHSKVFDISLCCDILGDFNEEFDFAFKGALSLSKFTIKGNVVGPTFNFDIDVLDFQNLAYGFLSTRIFNLINTSHIPMTYRLRIPESSGGQENYFGQESELMACASEFVITPEFGSIPPLGVQSIQVDFKPMRVGAYKSVLAVDLESIAPNMLQIPLFAMSMVSEIGLKSPRLSFGGCYLNYTYHSSIELENQSELPVRYSFLPQDEVAQHSHIYSSRNPSGIIAPNSSILLDVELLVKRSGDINFTITVQILGLDDHPFLIDVTAMGCGPTIAFTTTELNFGKVPVLKDISLSLIMKNNSPIGAEFSCNIASDSSVFIINPMNGKIPPGEEIQLTATVYLDDCITFTDMLKINVISDAIHEIQLVARGFGSTIIFDQKLLHVDFKDILSNSKSSVEFVMSNMGRRSQTLHWLQDDKQKVSLNKEVATKALIDVVPNRFTLRPGAQQLIQLKAFSHRAVACRENLMCIGTIDKNPNRTKILISQVSANFIDPLLEIQPPSLSFLLTYSSECSLKLEYQNISLKNISSLPLTLSIRCENAAYSIILDDIDQGILLPYQCTSAIVQFDPSFHNNRISCKEHSRIVISYLEHPQLDIIEIESELSFPNLHLSEKNLNFGCISIDTEQRQTFTMTNSDILPVHYSWCFLDDSIRSIKSALPEKNSEVTLVDIPAYQVFDILPLSGIIAPGASQSVEVNFYGHLGKFCATALCDVVGGPKYEMEMVGEASLVHYLFNKTTLNFGSLPYQEINEQEIYLSNTGSVAFEFHVAIPAKSSLHQKLWLSPPCAQIQPLEKQKICIRFCSCAPETTDDFILVHIAHFEPIKIHITGSGTYSSCLINLDRVIDPEYDLIRKGLCSSKPYAHQNLSPLTLEFDAKVLEEDLCKECDRILVKNRTLQFLSQLSETLGKTKSASLASRQKFVGSLIIANKLRHSKDRKSISLIETSQVKLATYQCHFGNVARNSSKKMSIKLLNQNNSALAVHFDKSLLTGTGFSVSSDCLKSSGKEDVIELHLSFCFKGSVINIKTSLCYVLLPILIAGGPTLYLSLFADITIPELTLSTHLVDFGEVISGQRKTVFLMVSNLNKESCEWAAQILDPSILEGNTKITNASSRKQYPALPIQGEQAQTDLVLLPSAGFLKPGEKAAIMLQFSPSSEKEFVKVIHFKVNSNLKHAAVKVVGKGAKLYVEFDPVLVTLGPILPCADRVEAKVQIYNPTDYTIELYSLEFDRQYIEEEDMLQKLDIDENGGVFHIPTRELGHSYHENIIELKNSIAKQDRESLNATGSVCIWNKSPENHSTFAHCIQKSIASPDKAVNVIIFGPPYSGKTSYSKRLTEDSGQIYLHLDEIVEIYRLENESLINPNAVLDDEYVLKESRPAIDDIDLTTASERPDNLDHRSVGLSEGMAIEIIKLRLLRDDCQQNGFVIDGLDCKYISNVLALLKGAVKSGKRKLLFVHLTLDFQSIREREISALRTSGEKGAELFQFQDITDEKYDALSVEDMNQYDICVLQYKKRKKELSDKRKVERRKWEDSLALERKDQEDGKSSKKKTSRKATPVKDIKAEKPLTAPKIDGKASKAAITESASPKLLKMSERNDKESRAEKASDKLDFDELSSRVTLFELIDTFFNDSTFRKYEQYSHIADTVTGWLQDCVKGNVEKLAVALIDKKMTKSKLQNAAYNSNVASTSGDQIASTLNVDKTFNADDVPALLIEINASAVEIFVYRQITDFLPDLTLAIKRNALMSNQVPEPYLEQIVVLPTVRCEVQKVQKCFNLLTPAHLLEQDDEPYAVERVSVAPVKAESSKKRTIAKIILDEPKLESDGEFDKDSSSRCRWIIPSKESRKITLRFASNDVGKFEQKLGFEIVGAQHDQLNLECIGYCQYPQIMSDYRKIFTKWRKTKEEKCILHGEYIVSTGTFEFGPLLYAKPREKFQEKSPENHAVFTISNASNTEIKVNFALKHDVKGEIFFLDPAIMELAVGQTKQLNVWAYPKSAMYYEDILICRVKDNPEPNTFKISCSGVKPEIEVGRKSLSFDKLLLGRKEQRELKLKNIAIISIGWRLVGHEGLGEEFEISPLEGILEPMEELVVVAQFHALKPSAFKRSIKLEVFDCEKIGGIAMEIPIWITAEAYDIAMDFHFPKGFDGLDFGVLKVAEESRQLCSLKNKGKYEVGYRLSFATKSLNELFSISPQQGVLQPTDKPYPVHVVFKASREVNIKDIGGLKCVWFEPNTSEVTCTQLFKLSARSVYSKFSIFPVRDLNFGAIIHGTKGSKQFIIENLGEFDFKFNLFRGGLEQQIVRPGKNLQLQARSTSPPLTKPSNRKYLVKAADASNFGVIPTSGTCAAGQKLHINAEFHPEAPGYCEETIVFDISERSPKDQDVLEYRLLGESCIPGINTSDFASIFEEQVVCKRLEVINLQCNIYAQEEKVFHFGAYLAGQVTQIKIKISNPFKVPCDVIVNIKARSRAKSDASDFAFDVEPNKLSIQSHEYKYVVITFHPTSIQSYSGIFDAIVENVADHKNKNLCFEIRGEGVLPRVNVEKPSTRDKSGVPLIHFPKLLLGATKKEEITIKNEGMISAKFQLEWQSEDPEEFACSDLNTIHILKPLEVQSFEILCKPTQIRKFESQLKVKVMDNTFEDTYISLSGEGYLDDLTFDNIPFNTTGENEIMFSECYIGKTKSLTFGVTNHSQEYVRLLWSESPEFVFSHKIMHIRPRATVQLTISFTPNEPCDVIRAPLTCESFKIQYLGPTTDTDWDDTQKSVKWISSNFSESQIISPQRIFEPVPEPLYTILPQSSSVYNLYASAFADFSSYECTVTEAIFEPTMMFQSRISHFNVKNTGKIGLNFNTLFFDAEGQVVESDSLLCPFSTIPRIGMIEPCGSLSVELKFSPIDEGKYENFHMVFMVPNLANDMVPLNISIFGQSTRPYCHFELEDNDYVANERSTIGASSTGASLVIEPGTKVIKFGSCGVKVKNTQKFFIVNPTSNPWDFDWSCINGETPSSFRCITQKGSVLPGKKYEIAFEFTPESIDLKESLWQFRIPKLTISVPLLLVGKAVEPNVHFDKVSFNFKNQLVGRQIQETFRLFNNENIPLSFSFNETSSESSDLPVVKFNPASGIVGALSDIPIEISLNPSAEKSYNFNMACNVRRKPTPLTINVKGEGYAIHESIYCEMMNVESHLTSNSENLIEFGPVQVNEKRIKRVIITNSGKFSFEFAWKFLTKAKHGIVTVVPEIGTVGSGEHVACELSYQPTSTNGGTHMKGLCQILNGRTFPITIVGSGICPKLKFSKQLIDFETQFLHVAGLKPYKAKISIINEDVKEISFDVILPQSPNFDVIRGPNTLAPKSSCDLEIFFTPTEAIAYNDNIKFQINGFSTANILLKGKGALFKVETVSPEHRSINFGSVRVGNSISRQIKLLNKSVIQAVFNIGPASELGLIQGHGIALNAASSEITLRPKGIFILDLKFSPLIRIPPFMHELQLQGPGVSRPLCIIQGACQGIDIKLESEAMAFGAVVQKSCTTRIIQLQNNGDIGAKFKWGGSKFAPDFSISPEEGYISPGMETPLEISFHPHAINPDIRYESLCCNVEGAKPLYLSITGMCIPQPPLTEMIKFCAPVRQSETKAVQLINKSSTCWRIHPIIDSACWSGLEVIDVEPGQTKGYDITFQPLEMTLDGHPKHEGSIFFPLPDGSGILYKLIGSAEKPLGSGMINRDIPCKSSHEELLEVTNWLKRPQRFKVFIELAKNDPSVVVKGNDFIDSPALSTRQYKLNFYSYKEGLVNVKLLFKNETSQEFMFYNLALKCTAPGVFASYDMIGPVRQTCLKEINIVNPLGTAVTFNNVCSHSDITVPHTFTIPAKAESIFNIEFLPLIPRESSARLTVSSAELGVYQYDLRLVSTNAAPEKSLHFNVGLGASQVQTFSFLSFSKTKTEFSCKTDNSEFTVEKSISAPSALNGGVDVSVDITYEPSKLGDSRCNLIISSPTGGDYLCPLYGNSNSPRPQGPIIVKPGGVTTMPFKNVFSSVTNFNFAVDNPAFSVKEHELIAPKKTVSMTIHYKGVTPTMDTSARLVGSAKGASSKVAKLTVTSAAPSISWVYYLKTADCN